MKLHSLNARYRSKLFSIAFFAALVISPAVLPVKAHTQEAAVQSKGSTVRPQSPNDEEGKPSQEKQEQAFLNSTAVHKFAGLLHISEPLARTIFLIINFAIIFLAIAIPLGKVMPKVFRKRSQTLRFHLDEARKASEEARRRMSAVEAKLAGLDREIASFRAQVEHDSQEDEKRIKASIKEESERIVHSAEQEINIAAAHARHSLQTFAADLAISNAARQLKLTPENDRALINEFIEEVGGQPAGNGEVVAAGKGGAK